MQTLTSRDSRKSENQLQQHILEARESRQEMLDTLILHKAPAISISLSIPGEEKQIPGSDNLFRWALAKCLENIPAIKTPTITADILGPYALYRTDLTAAEAKTAAVAIEERFPAARLLDIDIHLGGMQIDRRSLGLPERSCLLCPSPAKECIRTGRHSIRELAQAAHDLLASFGS